MDIGSRITKRLEDGGFKQSALAAQFVERAKARKVERNRVTVESHLSRLKSSDRTAVQFFFTDLNDAKDLMDLLAVPAEERSAMLDAAIGVLAPEERPVRLVVDLTTGPQDRAFVDACEGVNQQLLDGTPPRIVLVMTEAQREYLLPRYADENRVSVEVVRGPTEGEARARSLAGDAARVASTWPLLPISRWVALRWPDRNNPTLGIEPPDAIEALRKGHPLPGQESAAHDRDLKALAPEVTAAPPNEYAPDAPTLRCLIVSLLRGDPIEPLADRKRHREQTPPPSPALRQSWALHLGIRAAATPREWADHLVAKVSAACGPSEVIRGPEGTLRAEITKVERGAKTPRIVVDGTSVHLINPTPESATPLKALPGLTIHTVSPRVSAVACLREALAQTSRQALLDDPHLERMVATLAAEHGNRAELAFVAACLLVNDATNVKDAPRLRAWNAALRSVLALDPPAVGLRVPRGERNQNQSDFVRIALGAPEGSTTVLRDGAQVVGVPAAEHLRLTRGEHLLICEKESRGFYDHSIPELPRRHSFDDGLAVYGEFERSSFRAGDRPVGETWRGELVKLVGDFWPEVDRHLAMTWLALRRASNRADAVTLHEGTGILEMGGGLVAEVSAYEVPSCPRTGPCEAELLLPLFTIGLDRYSSRAMLAAGAVLQTISLRSAVTGSHTTWTQAYVPHMLFLACENVRVLVQFRATQWDTAATIHGSPLVEAAAASVKRDDDE